MAQSKPSRMELVLWNYVRNNFERRTLQNVPAALKYLMLNFAKRLYNSKILLSHAEDIKFHEFIQTQLAGKFKINFLFRASDHRYDTIKFHKVCDKWKGTLTLIKCKNGGIFGGYTSQSWKPDVTKDINGHGYKKDESAFLFLWKSQDEHVQRQCPLTFHLDSHYEHTVNYAIYCHAKMGPTWGQCGDIVIDSWCDRDIGINSSRNAWDKKKRINWSKLKSYHNKQVSLATLCGGGVQNKDLEFPENYMFKLRDFEVFHIAY